VLALVRSCTSPSAVTAPTSVTLTRTNRAAVPAGKARSVSERYWPELYQSAAALRQVTPSLDRSIAAEAREWGSAIEAPVSTLRLPRSIW